MKEKICIKCGLTQDLRNSQCDTCTGTVVLIHSKTGRAIRGKIRFKPR